MGSCLGLPDEPGPRLKATGAGIAQINIDDIPNPGDDVPLPHYIPTTYEGFDDLHLTRHDDKNKINQHAKHRVYFICGTKGTPGFNPDDNVIVVFTMFQIEEGKQSNKLSKKEEWYEGWKMSDLKSIEYGTEPEISGTVLGTESNMSPTKFTCTSVKFTFAGRPTPLIFYGKGKGTVKREIEEAKEAAEKETPLVDDEGNPTRKYSEFNERVRQRREEQAEEREKNPKLIPCVSCKQSGRTANNKFQCGFCKGTGWRVI